MTTWQWRWETDLHCHDGIQHQSQSCHQVMTTTQCRHQWRQKSLQQQRTSPLDPHCVTMTTSTHIEFIIVISRLCDVTSHDMSYVTTCHTARLQLTAFISITRWWSHSRKYTNKTFLLDTAMPLILLGSKYEWHTAASNEFYFYCTFRILFSINFTHYYNWNKKYVLSNSESVQCNFFSFYHVTFVQFKICYCVQNFIEIGWFFTEIWRYNDFQNGGRPPS